MFVGRKRLLVSILIIHSNTFSFFFLSRFTSSYCFSNVYNCEI